MDFQKADGASKMSIEKQELLKLLKLQDWEVNEDNEIFEINVPLDSEEIDELLKHGFKITKIDAGTRYDDGYPIIEIKKIKEKQT